MIIDRKKLSPMMSRYFEIKDKHQDSLLFFRLGDFYEMFFDDAVTASKALDLTLTGRDCGLSERAPMCGVPHHAVDNYIRKLIEAGFRVAICEQLSDPKDQKGMVERDVVRVVSAGTLLEDNILDEKSSNYLVSIFTKDNGFGLAWCDISTAEFNVYEYSGEDYLDRLSDMLSSISPVECVTNSNFSQHLKHIAYFKQNAVSTKCYYDYAYNQKNAKVELQKLFGTNSLEPFEIEDKLLAQSASGGLVEYIYQTQKKNLTYLKHINLLRDNSFMILDSNTRRNLELIAGNKGKKTKNTLLSVLDKTSTSMGARYLKKVIEQPLQDEKEINNRLDAVEEFVSFTALREQILDNLGRIRDLERLVARLAYGKAKVQDLISIADSLIEIPELKSALNSSKSKLIGKLNKKIFSLDKISDVLNNAFSRSDEDKQNGIIKPGFNSQLDELKNIHSTAKIWLRQLEQSEKEATGIKTLKVGYNRVFGYYIEVSNSFKDKVPSNYLRKQTLVNGERFITEELKQIEEKVLSAESNVEFIENEIFNNIIQLLLSKLDELMSTARAIAEIDILVSFAVVSVQNGYSKPTISSKVKELSIIQGRHPVVEKIVGRSAFISNDTLIDNNENRTLVITGPNMSGKSTYMRQVAVITLMAHIGCFVPAESAVVPITDRIFTRIGASDDLATGQSTFMVEMVEVATILNYATSKSLLILDEIGRGTSTYDGLSIAWAVLDYLTKNIKAKSLFSTHYHELTELESIDGIKNYRVLVRNAESGIVFLHKIARGGAGQSYGIEVASLAGVKREVIEKAKRIMSNLEKESMLSDVNQIILNADDTSTTAQVSMFESAESKVETQILATDVENLTPLQALTILTDLKAQLKK